MDLKGQLALVIGSNAGIGAKNDGELRKLIAMERQRVDISSLRYPVEWLFDVWIQKIRSDHRQSSDPDEQG